MGTPRIPAIKSVEVMTPMQYIVPTPKVVYLPACEAAKVNAADEMTGQFTMFIKGF